MLCFSSAYGRQLNAEERALSLSVRELIRLNQEYLSKINSSLSIEELPLSKYLSLIILKNGCSPFVQAIEHIEMADDTFPDQSTGLSEKLKICKNSTHALKDFDVIADEKDQSQVNLISDQ